MKTDNTNTNAAVPHRNELSEALKGINHKNKTPVIITILPILSILAAVLTGYFLQVSKKDMVRLGIITLILSGAVTFYIRLYMDSILSRRLSKTIIVFGYLGSILALLLVPSPELYSFWMIGGLVVAMLVNNKLGLLFNFNMTFIMGIVQALRPELLIQILIVCLLLSTLAGALRNKATVIYASIIILSTNMTLSFVVNNFIIDEASNYKYFDSLFSMIVILFAAFILSALYQSFLPQKTQKAMVMDQKEQAISQKLTFEEKASEAAELSASGRDNLVSSMSLTLVDNEDQALRESAAAVYDTGQMLESKTGYLLLCDLNNELILKLRSFSESLYAHSVYIGELSGRAAKEIGADELLAMAGGLYHEIGRMNGKIYIDEGLKLAEEYSFPKELKAILKEHNIKYDRPSSVEAAIVMLSDNIVSTIEYIDKAEDHKIKADKIIDNIFQMRLDKGTLDSSGISVKEYKKLKEFYHLEFGRTNELPSE